MLLKRREAVGEDAYHYCWLQTEASFPFLSQKDTRCFSTIKQHTMHLEPIKENLPILFATIWRILCRRLPWRVIMSPCCHGGAMFFWYFFGGSKSTFGSDPQDTPPAKLGAAKRYFHSGWYRFGP